MPARYKVRGALRQSDYAPTPDELYWLLGSLDPDGRPWIVIESHENAGRFIQAHFAAGRRVDVEFREDAQAEFSSLPALDILTAHQVILGCLSSPQGWREVAVRTAQDVEHSSYDYARSGLSVQAAMLDYAGSAKHHDVAIKLPPAIRWDGHLVTTGDVWAVSEAGTLSVVIENTVPGQRHGISISSATPGLRSGEESSLSEVLLWPSDERTTFDVHHDGTVDALRICNVFVVDRGDVARVDRWIGDAGLWVEVVGPRERLYHCNHYATSPPTFDDLTFRALLAQPT